MPLSAAIELRAPLADEHAALSDLCMRSKAVHGYDAAFMAACRAELAVTAETLGKGPACVAADARNGVPLGFAQVSLTAGQSELEAMFVDPEAIGHGVGRRLFGWSV